SGKRALNSRVVVSGCSCNAGRIFITPGRVATVNTSATSACISTPYGITKSTSSVPRFSPTIAITGRVRPKRARYGAILPACAWSAALAERTGATAGAAAATSDDEQSRANAATVVPNNIGERGGLCTAVFLAIGGGRWSRTIE